MLATGVVGAVEDPWIRWSWISGHVDVITAALSQHVQLTLIAVVLGLLIAVPLGLVAWRSRLLRGPIFSLTGILYTIPSLALFSFLLPFTGLTILTAEIGLVSYTLLILVRNIVVGLNAVPDEVREAARGMGLSEAGILRRIEVPLALPLVLAGMRTASVNVIATAKIIAARIRFARSGSSKYAEHTSVLNRWAIKATTFISVSAGLPHSLARLPISSKVNA